MSTSASSERRLFLALIVLAPLPLASNRPAMWTALGVGVGALLLLRAWRGGLGPWPPWLWAAGGLFAVAPFWALIQAVPGVPEAWHHPVWQGLKVPGSIGALPEAAVTGALRLTTYGGAFLLALHHARSGHGAGRMLRVLGLAAAAYAVYGLTMLLSGAEMILWWDKWAYRGVFTATFVNRNAAAAFMGLGLLVALTVTLRAWRRMDALALWRFGGIAGLCVVALLLSQSRAGLGAALAGGLVLGAAVLWARRPPWRRVRRVVAGVAFVGLLGVALAGGGMVDRFGASGIRDSDRAMVHAAVVEAIAARPWLGQGLGSFDLTFPAWRPEALRDHWDYAHATWLELVYELGIPAAVAFHLAFVVIALVLVGGLRLRWQRQEYPALGLGVMVLAAFHGLVDFPFQMPANALWLATLLGLACAQSAPTRFANKPLMRAASDNAAPSPASARR